MVTGKTQTPISFPEPPGERLDSWKEIAAYLKRDERTVRRWETEGMPVHRKVHKKQASVYAYRAEIDAWCHNGRQRLEQNEQSGRDKQLVPGALAGPVMARHLARRWWVVAAVGLAVAALAALALRSPQQPMVIRYVQLTNDVAQKFYPSPWVLALVSDGSSVYFTEAAATGRWGLAQVSVSGGEAVSLPTPFENVSVAGISPIRSEFLLVPWETPELDAHLWILPFPGGSPRRLGDLFAHDATWSSDGKTIVYGRAQELYVAKADGSDSHKLVTLGGIPIRPRWSPEGKLLRFTLHDVNTDRTSLWEISADGSNLHSLFPRGNDGRDDCCGTWTPDGKYFVFQSTRDGVTNISAIRENHGLLREAGPEPVQLTSGPINFFAPSPSTDGKRLFAIGVRLRGELVRYDSHSREFVTYLSGISAEELDFSRDGKWVVYVAYPEGTLWRSRVDGSERVQLTNSPMRAALPRWSPDGKRIAFAGSEPGGTWRIYLISAAGGTPEQLIPRAGSEVDPGWSPDGNSLVFGEPSLSPTPAIYLLDLATRNVSTLPGSQGLHSPRWSPDGRFVVALTKDSEELSLFDFTTRKWKELDTGPFGAFPTWSRNGEYVYFRRPFEIGAPFYRVRVADHTQERVAIVNLPRGLKSALWTGLAPDDSPLLIRDTSIQEIYALDLRLP